MKEHERSEKVVKAEVASENLPRLNENKAPFGRIFPGTIIPKPLTNRPRRGFKPGAIMRSSTGENLTLGLLSYILCRNSIERFAHCGLFCASGSSKQSLQTFICSQDIVNGRNPFAACPHVNQQIFQLIAWAMPDCLLMNMHSGG